MESLELEASCVDISSGGYLIRSDLIVNAIDSVLLTLAETRRAACTAKGLE